MMLTHNSLWGYFVLSLAIGISTLTINVERLAETFPLSNDKGNLINPTETESEDLIYGSYAAPCSGGQTGGTVFIDFNGNGADDGVNEDGPQNIKVQIFGMDADGAGILLETVFTDSNGDYIFSSPSITFGSGEVYRVEFSDIPSHLEASLIGSNNKTFTQFVTSANCNISCGLMDTELYCQEDAKLVINCYADGDNTDNTDVLISIPYNVVPQSNENNDLSAIEHEAVAMTIGSTFGLAYQRQSKTLFASAYIKRFSGLGPEGVGAIYKVTDPDDGNLSGELFLDLNTLYGGNEAGADPHDFTTLTGGGDVIDAQAFNAVGRASFGDLDISPDESELAVVNLNNRSLYIIPLGSDPKNPVAPESTTDIAIIPLADTGNPLPDLPAGVFNDEIRPFALKYKYGKLFVGMVTNGQSGGPLMALVYAYDFDANSFTKELEVPLNYNRGCGFGFGSTCFGPADWNVWLDQNTWPTSTPVGGLSELGFPQPMLTDIEFDKDGNMILGLRDRWGDQGGLSAPQPNAPYTLRISDAFGDILFADYSAGSWSVNISDFTDPSTGSSTEESVFGEDNYIAGGYFHEETAMGGLAIHHGYGTVVTPSMDPRSNAFSNGIDWFDLNSPTKSLDKALTVLTGGTSVYGKSYGLGEIEMICDPAPLQIGNYAWIDKNANGIQDPGEQPLSGMQVKLYTKPTDVSTSPVLVASTLTDSNGQYLFSQASDPDETWEEGFDKIERDSSYYIVFCGDSFDEQKEILTAGDGSYTLTIANTGQGDNSDLNDSDTESIEVPGVGMFPAICVTTEGGNYTFDAGFVPKPDVALIQVLDPSYDINSTAYGNPVKFLFTVYNQSIIDIDSLWITDYVPSGFSFDANEVGNENWSIGSAGYPEIRLDDLPALSQKSVCIYLTLEATNNAQNWINVAEISKGYANGFLIEDCDSKLDNDPTNNGGGLLNSDADDYIDGDGSSNSEDGVASTDQDNVDPATVPICDLALINVIDTPPAVIKDREVLKYMVVVENQGTVTATNIELNYKVPNGLQYLSVNDSADPSWNIVGDLAKATITNELNAGEKDSVCIYLALKNVASNYSDAWTTIAEISSFETPDDPGVKKTDIDSTPNDDFNDDSGGNPDDDTDDEVDGNGTGDPDDPIEDEDPALDEDDHDPAIIYVCDAAAIIYEDANDSPQYGDVLKYFVEIHNQGNGPITNIEIINKLGDGLGFVSSTINTEGNWSVSSPGVLETRYENIILPGDNATICLELQLLPDHQSDADSWLQQIEIKRFEIPSLPGIAKSDLDSTPDDDVNNDSGGNPDDDTDDSLDGDGSGDPNDQGEDGDPDLDEDDNDPVLTKVYDLALKMQLDSMPPVNPVRPGDVLKFRIMVYNQGNTAANNIRLANYVMEENLFLNAQSKIEGWVENSSELSSYTINETLEPGLIDTTCVYLEVVSGAMSDIITWAEIAGSTETDEDCYDIDSNPNSDNTDDVGGNTDDETDDHINDNGSDWDGDGITDEDDHDPAMISVQDLALYMWADQKEPVVPGDDVKFIIKVVNQGNIINENIEVTNYIPTGFRLSPVDNNEWTEQTDFVVTKTLPDALGMFDTATTCIILRVQEGVNAGNLINYAEISNSTDELGNSLNGTDIDSTPDSLKNNDTGGEPSDPVDCDPYPYVLGDDNNISGAGVNMEDEDDHDPAWVPVFDLAAIIYTDQTIPIIPGDDIKMYVDVHNQGNMAAENVLLSIYMPDGFSLSPMDLEDWDVQIDGSLELQTDDQVLPGERNQYCLILRVNDDFTLPDLIPFVEISSVMDTLGNNRNMHDLDSDPDFSAGNDFGGIPDTDLDNRLDGTGLFGDDEDDHDPVVPPVLDLAINIITEDNSPKIPGDLVKFRITVYNQGSITPGLFTIENYIPEGLSFEMSPENAGWTSVGSNAVFEYSDPLLPLDSDTLCIYLTVEEGAHPNNVVNMVEISSIFDIAGMDISTQDIDSEADNSNLNDKGNDLYSDEDNKLFENGRSGGDEDDHDQAFILLCQEMLCISDVNVSLDGNCEIILSPGMFLEGDLFPEDFYEYHIYDDFGNMVEVTSFDVEDVGNTYQLSISAPICSNSCWMNVTVEYKLPPVIDCPSDMTLSCGSLDLFGVPPATGGCAPFEVILVNEAREALQCDSLYTHIVERTYRAVDSFGNFSECSHIVTIERIDLNGIFFPEPFSLGNGNPISCNDPNFEFDENGIPVPWATNPMTGSGSGVPILCDPDITNGLICPGTGDQTGVPLIPGENQELCSAIVTFTDLELPEIGCVRKIMRTWEVREWWCNGENTAGGIQLIEIIDDTAPVFTCPDDFSVSTNDNCAGTINLPAITATDACDHGFEVRIDYPNGFLNSNGGEAELEVGSNEIVYIVNDECYNTASCTVNVLVADETEPVAICERNTVVSISLQGNTITAAEVYDDGSWDECGLHRFEVRRMDTTCVASDTSFGDFIHFCCSDVGQDIMVVFRAIDISENYNDCMVNVAVQDKFPPVMTCPDDVTIDCREAYDLNNLGVTFGMPEIIDNCADMEDVFEIITPDVNQCGIGQIARKFELRDDQGIVLRTCKQNVSIINTAPFVASNIQWPIDIELENICGLEALKPENLPVLSAFPIYLAGDDQCSLLGYDYEDTIFEATPGSGECAHIERVWRVINWCSQVDGLFEVFEIPSPQVIILTNTIAPELVDVEDQIFESGNVDCLSGELEITRMATNDCNNELNWYYEIKELNGEFVQNGFSDTIHTILPVGNYNIFWRVEDGCGNFDVDTVGIEVLNTKSPSPVCIQGLSVNMEQWHEVELNVNQVDGGSYHTCNNDITLSFAQDTTIKDLVFECEDVGLAMIQLWVTDVITGAQDFCSTFIDIQDNEELCPPNGNLVSVSGEVHTEVSDKIENVNVELGIPDLYRITDEEGYYAFDNMPIGGAYEIAPDKEGDYLNGVSTLDLILIQRHILGQQFLDSPYKLIAADVDNSKDISAVDLVELRKLILGVYNELPNNASWRFVDQSYTFPDVQNPWLETFPESYPIPELKENMFIDFVGVKIGDVNNNAYTSDETQKSSQPVAPMVVYIDNEQFLKGEEAVISFYSKNYEQFAGWQGTLMFDSNRIELIDMNAGDVGVDDNNFSLHRRNEGLISFSFNADNIILDKEHLILFELKIRALDNIKPMKEFNITSDITRAESYTKEGKVSDLKLNQSHVQVFNNVTISPNPWVDEVKVAFDLVRATDVTVEVFDVSGKLLWVKDDYYNSGRNFVTIEGDEIPTSGVHYVKLKSKEEVSELKMLKIE